MTLTNIAHAWIDQFERYNVTYRLYLGTLLGAIRSGEIIPGDNDWIFRSQRPVILSVPSSLLFLPPSLKQSWGMILQGIIAPNIIRIEMSTEEGCMWIFPTVQWDVSVETIRIPFKQYVSPFSIALQGRGTNLFVRNELFGQGGVVQCPANYLPYLMKMNGKSWMEPIYTRYSSRKPLLSARGRQVNEFELKRSHAVAKRKRTKWCPLHPNLIIGNQTCNEQI